MSSTQTLETATTADQLELVDLVDALVQAIDLDRTEEVDRIREALEPFGAVDMFNDELRLNGSPSSECGPCECGVWL
ncbi:MAG: hypothetical protein ACRBK7_02185 [Acidimicrobiales bacterium]